MSAKRDFVPAVGSLWTIFSSFRSTLVLCRLTILVREGHDWERCLSEILQRLTLPGKIRPRNDLYVLSGMLNPTKLKLKLKWTPSSSSKGASLVIEQLDTWNAVIFWCSVCASIELKPISITPGGGNFICSYSNTHFFTYDPLLLEWWNCTFASATSQF